MIGRRGVSGVRRVRHCRYRREGIRAGEGLHEGRGGRELAAVREELLLAGVMVRLRLVMLVVVMVRRGLVHCARRNVILVLRRSARNDENSTDRYGVRKAHRGRGGTYAGKLNVVSTSRALERGARWLGKGRRMSRGWNASERQRCRKSRRRERPRETGAKNTRPHFTLTYRVYMPISGPASRNKFPFPSIT